MRVIYPQGFKLVRLAISKNFVLFSLKDPIHHPSVLLSLTAKTESFLKSSSSPKKSLT